MYYLLVLIVIGSAGFCSYYGGAFFRLYLEDGRKDALVMAILFIFSSAFMGYMITHLPNVF